jgi:hypothetical protein
MIGSGCLLSLVSFIGPWFAVLVAQGQALQADDPLLLGIVALSGVALTVCLPRWRGLSRTSPRVYLLAIPLALVVGLIIDLPWLSGPPFSIASTAATVVLAGLPAGLFFAYVLRACGRRSTQLKMGGLFLLAVPCSIIFGVFFGSGGADADEGDKLFASAVVLTFVLATFIGGSNWAGFREPRS